MTAAHEAIGSWHRSGYFGHYRSRIRNDYVNEFRKSVRPQPPQRFINRSRQAATRHVFSKHDNKEKFLNDALYFEQGLGRKRVHSASRSRNPDFIAWMPHKKELDVRSPLTSSYRDNYHNSPNYRTREQLYATNVASNGRMLRQKLKSIDKDFDESNTISDGLPIENREHFQTTYRKIHCTEEPTKPACQQLNQIGTKSALCRRVISRSKSVSGRESVATCLSWAPQPPSRPKSTVQPQAFPKPAKIEATPISQPAVPPQPMLIEAVV